MHDTIRSKGTKGGVRIRNCRVGSSDDCAGTIDDSRLNEYKCAEGPPKRAKVHKFVARMMQARAVRGISLRKCAERTPYYDN